MKTRRAFLAGLLLAVGISAAPAPPAGPRLAPVGLPTSLTDQEFWHLIATFSEPGGTFHSDNFVSNEGRFQLVIPELVRRVRAGRLYIGVGPEQNFTYITAVRPRMAFILDIRRGNLQEHLLYKALMEMSTDRADFLSRLFSRERPDGLTATSSVESLFAAFDAVRPSEVSYRGNLNEVVAWLTTVHDFPLSDEDIGGIDYIYGSAFFADGPQLGYRFTGQGTFGQHPTYADLMVMDDGTGRQWSYLASEENFSLLKDLQAKNLVVPIVGDFGGQRALRAIAEYARDAGTTVSAFYLSNVEQYLRQDGKLQTFCATVASMPLDASSTFIRSRVHGRGLGARPPAGGLGMFWSGLGTMQTDVQTCTYVGGGLRAF